LLEPQTESFKSSGGEVEFCQDAAVKREIALSFFREIAAQAVGTALGAGILFVVAKAAGAFDEVPWDQVGLGAVLLAAALLALGTASTSSLEKSKHRVIKEMEERLRGKTGEERMRIIVPHPGGFATAPWILEGMKTGFREEVEDSIEQARAEGKLSEYGQAGEDKD
jgi:hypothetical protein